MSVSPPRRQIGLFCAFPRWALYLIGVASRAGFGGGRSGQGAGVVEAGEGGDLVAVEGEDEQPGGVRNRGVLVAQVQAEGGLGVGAGGHEAEAAACAGSGPVAQEGRDR